MAPAVTPRNPSISWKRSLAGKPIRSIHVWLAVLFNCSLILNLARTFHVIGLLRKSDSELLVLLAFVISFLMLADFSILQVYLKARAEVRMHESSPVLEISYIAFRLDMLVLGIGIMLSGIINLVS